MYSIKPEINQKIWLIGEDVTKMNVDAIVNTANKSLLGGSGVDRAVHEGAGPKLLEECLTLGGCGCGEAKITKGYNLRAKHVVHVVGPRNGDGNLLEKCYFNSLELARSNNIKSIAFPCISTGACGFPKQEAAQIVLKTTRQWLEKHNDEIDVVMFCLIDDEDKKYYNEGKKIYFPCA